MGYRKSTFEPARGHNKKVLADGIALAWVSMKSINILRKYNIWSPSSPRGKTVARRIIWAKFLNAGQTCIAPDYLLVHSNIQEEPITEMQKSITRFFGDDPKQSPDFGRIINTGHFLRLKTLWSSGKIVSGGVCINDTIKHHTSTKLPFGGVGESDRTFNRV